MQSRGPGVKTSTRGKELPRLDISGSSVIRLKQGFLGIRELHTPNFVLITCVISESDSMHLTEIIVM